MKIDFTHIIEGHSFLDKYISQRYPNMLLEACYFQPSLYNGIWNIFDFADAHLRSASVIHLLSPCSQYSETYLDH